MMDAMKKGQPHRTSAKLALHVVDVLQALHESAELGLRITTQTKCEQPPGLPPDAGDEYFLDLLSPPPPASIVAIDA
jgi:hypothetical protein